MSAAFIFEEWALKNITILVMIFPLPMLQAIFKPSLEEKIIISV